MNVFNWRCTKTHASPLFTHTPASSNLSKLPVHSKLCIISLLKKAIGLENFDRIIFRPLKRLNQKFQFFRALFVSWRLKRVVGTMVPGKSWWSGSKNILDAVLGIAWDISGSQNQLNVVFIALASCIEMGCRQYGHLFILLMHSLHSSSLHLHWLM